MSAVELGREAIKRINQSRGINGSGVVAEGVENRVHFKMRIDKRGNGDLEIAFEGGAVGADMEVDRIDG